MIENFEKKRYESFGIDLNNFCKETMIKRFENVHVTGINVLILIYKMPVVTVTNKGVYLLRWPNLSRLKIRNYEIQFAL